MIEKGVDLLRGDGLDLGSGAQVVAKAGKGQRIVSNGVGAEVSFAGDPVAV